MFEPSRLTVVTTVYHQVSDEEPISFESKFDRTLLSDESPYKRRMKISSAWTRLDRGCLEKASMVSITNHAGQGLQQIPSFEEAARIKTQHVEVGILCSEAHPSAFCSIPPGEEVRFQPSDVTGIWMRCVTGETRVSTVVFPE